MARPTFAVPLPQSSRSEVLEWRFPKPYSHFVLTGKSRAAWHTSFIIPQLNLLLDAGLCVNNSRPKHIFLTHGHNDHTLLSPAFVKREDPPDIFCPAEMRKVFDDFILANTMLNLGGLIGPDDTAQAGTELNGSRPDNTKQPGERPKSKCHSTHITHPVRHGDVFPLRRIKDMTATAFDCHHSVPCVGYFFSITSNRLKPEYTSLSGLELKALRQSGAQITNHHSTPVFAFLGDTTAETLAAEPEWLQNGISVVITECSFLYEEHRAQADRTRHTIWADLEKVVRKWPSTTFVLMHFSLRYTDEDVKCFFLDMENPPNNIVIWVDGEDA